MSKIERLNARVAKLLTVAVREVLEVVRETVSEYQEKTARTQRENESLRRRLQELQDKVKRVSTGYEQSAAPPISGERASIEQEWNPSLRQDTELILTEEKQELTEEHIIRQREEEGSGLESDHMADSEIDCDILVSGNGTLGTEGISSKTDAALLVYTSHPVISNTDMDSIHAVNITNPHSPKTSNFGILPSLGSDEIKIEPDSLEYTTSQHSSQNIFYECAESRSNMAQTDSVQELEQVDTESYGLAYFNPNTSFGERFAFGKNRSVVDSRHKQYYGKEEQHRCILCGKTFSRVGNLRIHQRCHTGEKPYSCMQCGRRFSHAGNLKKHKRVHTGERPYCCHQCGKTFSQSSHLKKHQKIHIVRHFSVA